MIDVIADGTKEIEKFNSLRLKTVLIVIILLLSIFGAISCPGGLSDELSNFVYDHDNSKNEGS